MANKIAQVPILEALMKDRYVEINGDRIQIGQFWSVLQIYACIQRLQISVKTLASIASLVEERVDGKYRKNRKPINPIMIRNHLHLKSTPCQIGHTVVTKTVSKGASDAMRGAVKEVLLKNNSYGESLLNDVMAAVEAGKGIVTGRKATVMGVSDFNAVLGVALMLLDMERLNYLKGLSEIKNSDHKCYLVEKIREYQNTNEYTEEIGITI